MLYLNVCVEVRNMSKISHPALQRLMKKEHAFLYKLYTSNGRQNRHTLNKASKLQVFLVLRLLYCISAGHIPLTKSAFEEVIRRKKRALLARMKSRSVILRKKESLFNRRKYVLQYSSVYPFIFEAIFNDV